MVSIVQDPHSDRLILSATVVLYIERLLHDILASELESAIRAQAVKDLQSNATVQQEVAKAATAKLLQMLGVPESSPKSEVR